MTKATPCMWRMRKRRQAVAGVIQRRTRATSMMALPMPQDVTKVVWVQVHRRCAPKVAQTRRPKRTQENARHVAWIMVPERAQKTAQEKFGELARKKIWEPAQKKFPKIMKKPCQLLQIRKHKRTRHSVCRKHRIGNQTQMTMSPKQVSSNSSQDSKTPRKMIPL